MSYSKIEKEKFDEAKLHSKNGDVEGTLNIMKELINLNPNSALFHAVLANSYWDNNQLVQAEEEFSISVVLAPNSEKYSLGLFHCLWENNKKEEALEEMKRFLSISESNDYQEILKEINMK